MNSTNSLQQLEAFKTVLNGYKPSDENISVLRNTKMVLMVGPTAAGRNTLINILVSTGRYHYIVSDTTRKPRENNGIMEQNGIEYWFKPEQEVLDGLRSGGYLEAAIIHSQQVSGISMAELKKAQSAGRIAINEIETDGADHIQQYKPDALFVFLLPPSFDIWMARIRGRGHMDEAEFGRRLRSAQDEITAALKEDFYHFVINNEIHEAAVAVDELANGRQPDPSKQQHGRDHAEQLAVDVRLYLENN